MKSGVLWVGRKGLVRDANGEAGVRTGLVTGRSLCGPDMARAASAVVAKRTPRALKALGRPAQQGGVVPVLDCRVIPGLAAGDAFVLIGQDVAADQGMVFQNRLQVVHHDLRDPLAAASQALQAACLGAGRGVEARCRRVDELLPTLNKLIDLATGTAPRRARPGRHRTGSALCHRPRRIDGARLPLPARMPADHTPQGAVMKRVLIVEDQADIRKLIRMTLEFEDFEVHEASDGVFGLRMANAVSPDLVLLDVMMPGELDGLQVCQAIKSNPALASVKVVLLTARDQARDIEAGQKVGADEYFVKPFSPLQLIDTIERLMAPA